MMGNRVQQTRRLGRQRPEGETRRNRETSKGLFFGKVLFWIEKIVRLFYSQHIFCPDHVCKVKRQGGTLQGERPDGVRLVHHSWLPHHGPHRQDHAGHAGGLGQQHSAPNRRWPLDASCCSSHRRFWICSLLDLALPLRSTLAAEYTSPQSMRRQSPAMPAVTVLGPQNSGEGRTKSKSKSAVQDRSLAGLHLVAPGATPTSARPIRCYRCAFRTPLGHTPRGALGWGGSPHRVQLSHPSDGSGHG